MRAWDMLVGFATQNARGWGYQHAWEYELIFQTTEQHSWFKAVV
jgi:hypothetical protein